MNMNKNYGYIITAQKKNLKTGTTETVALYEDSYTGGYIGWTNELLSAKCFFSEENAKNYYNCSFNGSLDLGNDYQITEPFNINKVVFSVNICSEYKSVNNK